MNLNKLVITLLLLVISVTGFSQNRTDFTSTGVTMSALMKNGKWSEYPAFKKTQVPITIDFEKNRIIIYSELEQVYRIAEYYPEQEKGDEYINFFRCLSNDGETTEITLKTSKKANISQMYIKDKTRVLVYNMKAVK